MRLSGLESYSCRGRLDKLELFSLERRWNEDLIKMYNVMTAICK